MPEPEPPARRRIPRSLIAAGGVVLLMVVGALAFLLTGSRHGNGNLARDTTASPSAGATGTAVAAPSPPTDVTAVSVGRTEARISWRDTAPVGGHEVVISLGRGQGARVRLVTDQSPQVVTGLTPQVPYCFAVGYVYSLHGTTSYSAVTSKACINGGTPGPAG